MIGVLIVIMLVVTVYGGVKTEARLAANARRASACGRVRYCPTITAHSELEHLRRERAMRHSTPGRACGTGERDRTRGVT
jgi:hypothetical protein